MYKLNFIPGICIREKDIVFVGLGSILGHIPVGKEGHGIQGEPARTERLQEYNSLLTP